MLWAPFALALALWDMRVALLVTAGFMRQGASLILLSSLASNRPVGSSIRSLGSWCLRLASFAPSWRDGLPLPSPRLLKLSAAVVAAAAIISTSAVGSFTALHSTVVAHLDLTKSDLGLVQLVHFLALAY